MISESQKQAIAALASANFGNWVEAGIRDMGPAGTKPAPGLLLRADPDWFREHEAVLGIDYETWHETYTTAVDGSRMIHGEWRTGKVHLMGNDFTRPYVEHGLDLRALEYWNGVDRTTYNRFHDLLSRANAAMESTQYPGWIAFRVKNEDDVTAYPYRPAYWTDTHEATYVPPQTFLRHLQQSPPDQSELKFLDPKNPGPGPTPVPDRDLPDQPDHLPPPPQPEPKPDRSDLDQRTEELQLYLNNAFYTVTDPERGWLEDEPARSVIRAGIRFYRLAVDSMEKYLGTDP